jgi:hypothetical protein
LQTQSNLYLNEMSLAERATVKASERGLLVTECVATGWSAEVLVVE